MSEMLPIGRKSLRQQLCFESEQFCSDCTASNIMFGASGMYSNTFQAVTVDRDRSVVGVANAYTRTQQPPVYYFTGFDSSRHYRSRDVMDEPLQGRDKSAREKRRCNPFQTDIYNIGNLVRQEFMEVRAVSYTHLRNWSHSRS
jgi:hypothetical protein